MGKITVKKTACHECEHFNNLMVGWPGGGGLGVCRHKDGPTGKVLAHEWWSRGRRYYPKGCPLDPSPKLVRLRPKKRRGSKPGPLHREKREPTPNNMEHL